MARVALGAIDNLLLLGGARLTALLAEQCAKDRWDLAVVSSPRHLDEAVDEAGTTLRDFLDRRRIPFLSSDDPNTDERVLAKAGGRTLGIALGAAWMFEPAFARRFGGKLLDFMGIRLPEYRGGAHYTWQILAGNRRGACNLQRIDGGPETFHRGPILRSETYSFPAGCRIPLDYFAAALPRELKFLRRFLEDVRRGRGFDLRRLDERAASFWPRLHTKSHGWIDWSWDAKRLERFICAFDEPYAGASTFVRGRRVHLKDVRRVRPQEDFHPFHSGLVYRREAGAVYVAAVGGGLRVGRVLAEDGSDASGRLEDGDRFTTPRGELDRALAFSAEYGASGLQEKRHEAAV